MSRQDQQANYTPPSTPEGEQSVLGAILVRPQVLDEVADILTPEDFYREAHGRIFKAMIDLFTLNLPVDLVTVTELLRERGQLEGVGGPVFLAALSEEVGFAVNASFYAQKVKDKAILRRLLDASQEIAGACFTPVENVREFLDAAEEKIFRIQDDQSTQVSYTLAEIVPGEVERLEQIYGRSKEIFGVPSGLIDLDNITAGWMPGDLIILAARPSMGKTAMALNNFAYHAAAKAGVPVAFFSQEQPKEQLVQRQLSSVGRINSYRLRSAKMEGQEWANLQVAAGTLMDTPIHIIDQPGLSPLAIRSQARRLKQRYGIGLVIVDYLQLLKQKGAKSREQEVAAISGGLKGLAIELGLPVIALSQLSRKLEERPNKRPQLADLRESGSLEQDADVVVFIYRDEVYKEGSPETGTAEITVAKHRNGPTGRLKTAYLKEYMTFENLTQRELNY